MEPLGIIVFSCIMGTCGFTIVAEGSRQLAEGAKSDLPNLWLIIGEWSNTHPPGQAAILYRLCCNR